MPEMWPRMARRQARQWWPSALAWNNEGRPKKNSLRGCKSPVGQAKGKMKKRWHYVVTAPNGDSCTFSRQRDADRAAIKIANAEGKAKTRVVKMTRSEFVALPATNGSARIAALAG